MTTSRRLTRTETKDGVLFVPVPIYRCWRCDSLMPVEREREPLCEVCESVTAQMAQGGPRRASAVGVLQYDSQQGVLGAMQGTPDSPES